MSQTEKSIDNHSNNPNASTDGFVDSHCHLTCDELYPKAKTLLDNAADFSDFLVISTNPKEFERAKKLKEIDPRIRLAFGYYPGDVEKITEEDMDYLKEQLEQNQLDVLGEIGLDYHWDDSHKKEQKELFAKQIELANAYHLPISIHMRDATKDTLDLLKEKANTKIIFHCYSGSAQSLKEILKMDALISFAGPITFKNNRKGAEAVAAAPLDRILSETDAPYLAPVPKRGKENEPSFARYTVEKIAQIQGKDLEEVKKAIKKNYDSLFQTDTIEKMKLAERQAEV